MKNKILTIIMAGLMVVAFAACGKEKEEIMAVSSEPVPELSSEAEEPTIQTSETTSPALADDSEALIIADLIKAEVEMKDGMKLVESEKNAENAYPGISNVTDKYAIYVNATGGYAEEIAVMVLKEGENMESLRELADERIKYQKITFEDYQPREMSKLENPVIVTDADILVLVVSDDSAVARSAIENALQ